MIHSKILFPKRPFQTPFFYRLMEGLTTLSMSIGFLMGGGQMFSSLFVVYVIHSLASFSFHLFPSAFTFHFDISMIDLVSMERAYTKSQNVWIYPCYILSMFTEDTKTHNMLIMRTALVILFTLIPSMYYICMWLLVLLTFLQSCHYVFKKDMFKTTLACCLFHLYLGVVSYMEVIHYHGENTISWIEKLVRYSCYLAFIFHTVTFITDNKRQLNCVLTFITSIILTPFSLYETWVQCQTPTIRYMDDLQEEMLLFYLAFCVMDMIIGYFYYPEYFKWLEGIVHHIVTMLFACYFLGANKKVNFCIGLIEEFSSIFLNLYRLFPHIPILKRLFHVSFVLFRIILPIGLMFYLSHILMDPASCLLHGIVTSMNIYWLFKQSSQTRKNEIQKSNLQL